MELSQERWERKPCRSILGGDGGTEESAVCKEATEEGLAFPPVDSAALPHLPRPRRVRGCPVLVYQ